jgi:hypothetical protein
MNDYVSLLWQCYAAKRELLELFQLEGFGPASQPSSANGTHESIPVARTGIKQTNRLFREKRGRHEVVPDRTLTVIGTSQPGEVKRDLTVSGFFFALVLVGVILAAYTDRPVFWLLMGPAPLAVLHTIRTFLRQLSRRQEGLPRLTSRIDENLQPF